MRICANCPTELCGLQTKFCSQHCKNVFGGSERYKARNAEYKEYRKKYYAEKREDILRQKAKYYKENSEEIIRKNNLHKKLHPESDVKYSKSVNGRYRDYKKGAKKRGLVFELSIEYFQEHWNDDCYYCRDKVNGAGFDRIDNDIGYTIENSVPCCGMCNRMKSIFNQNELIEKCNKISNNMALKGINITKNEHVFIDGATGQEYTRQQFEERYNQLGVARHRIDVSRVTETEGTGETKGQEDISVISEEELERLIAEKQA
jgi:hypothetical protein